MCSRRLRYAISGPAGRLRDTADRAAALAARTPPDAGNSPVAQAALALCDLVAGSPRERVRQRAESALAGRERRLRAGSDAEIGIEAPGMALLWIDELDRATELFTEAISDDSLAGRLSAFESHSALRGFALQRRGDLADASADLEPILAAAAQGRSPGPATLVALIAQVLLEVEHARAHVAEALASIAPIPATLERTPIVALLRHAQAHAQLAQRKFAPAATTLSTVGEICEANSIRAPAMFPWRSDLALAWAGTDRHHDGVELATAGAAARRAGAACNVRADERCAHSGCSRAAQPDLSSCVLPSPASSCPPGALSSAGHIWSSAPRCDAPAGAARLAIRSIGRCSVPMLRVPSSSRSVAARSCARSGRVRAARC